MYKHPNKYEIKGKKMQINKKLKTQIKILPSWYTSITMDKNFAYQVGNKYRKLITTH